MPIILKSRREIEMMRRSGKLGHTILHKMEAAVAPGVTERISYAIPRFDLNGEVIHGPAVLPLERKSTPVA